MKYIKIILLGIAVEMFSCGPKTIYNSTVSSYVSSENGIITMRANGVGKNLESAISDAEINAFETLLFRGLPASEQKTALIGTNEIEIKQKYQSYFQKFYQEGRYRTFMVSSSPVSPLTRLPSGYKGITIDIQINVPSLRIDLEQSSLVRKFGY